MVCHPSVFKIIQFIMPKIFIETSRLVLRQWEQRDHEPYVQMNADTQVMEFFPSVLSPEESLAQIGRMSARIAQSGFGFFAVERKDNREFIGFTGLSYPGFESYFTPCVEIGWRLSRHNWGHGFATEAANASLEFGFNTLKLEEIYAFTSPLNLRSEQVMKRIGMQKAGEFSHPLIADGHILKQHILYRINRPERDLK
jgi:[ribosomal protein S5]-alanine N-acetyltransferase